MISFCRALRPHLFFIILFGITWMLVAYVATKNSQGPHGGALKKAQDHYIEVKTADKRFYAFLLDKKLKTIGAKQVELAEARFFFPDSSASDVPLKPEKEDAFVCDAPDNFFASRVTFHIGGREVFARFSHAPPIAKKK